MARIRDPFPIPTRVLSNGEFTPPPQTPRQQQVERTLRELAEHHALRQGVSRRTFLSSASGMAAAFLAMNQVYGSLFQVDGAEAADSQAADEQRRAHAGQFVFDVQLHFVHERYAWEPLLGLRKMARKWNPDIKEGELSMEALQFQNFLHEVFAESDTTIGLLSGAPSDDRERWFLSNDQIAQAGRIVNEISCGKRLYTHALFTPGQKGWLEELERAAAELKPLSWKGYTIGDPLGPSQFPWRLDDEALVYPAYEKMVKSGIRNVCIHKGLLPEDYESSFPDTWHYAKVDDLPQAAKDWPQLNFIIYHSALKPIGQLTDAYLEEFERTGTIPWVTDLARIPRQHGVTNVYAELGTCFASSAVTHPRHAAALLGTLIQGMGADHVLWGTDSVWYGSPQWQIEAFRRLEIPEDMQEKWGYPPLGPADGPVKTAILGGNAAALYGIEPRAG